MSERRSALPWVLALVVAAGATLPWTVQRHWDAKPDAATYLLAARSLARGDGYRVMGEGFTLRPPGWSAVLAPVVAWRGIDFAALNLVGSAFGIAAAALLLLLLAPRVGNALAFATAAAVWANPWFQQLCNQVLSDVPGLAAALLALLAIRWSGRRDSLARDLLAAAAIAAASWVRTASLLLVPALLLERLLAPAGTAVPAAGSPPPAGRGRGRLASTRAGRVRRAAIAGGLAVAAYLPWALQPEARGTYGQESLRSYASALVRSDAVDESAGLVAPAQLAERVRANAVAYVGMLGLSSSPAPPASGEGASPPASEAPSPSLAAWLVAGAGLAGWLCVLVRRREAPEWLAGLTAATIAAYYVAQARLGLAVAVLALGATVEAVRLALGRVAPRGADAMLVVALALGAAAAFRGDPTRPRSAERWSELVEVTRYLRDTASPDERLGGDYGTVYALLLDRPVYGLQFLCNQRGTDAAREAVAGWSLDRLVLQSDGPCAALLDAGREEARRGAFIVLRRDPARDERSP